MSADYGKGMTNDTGAASIGAYVTPKHQNGEKFHSIPQYMVAASQSLPNAEVVLYAESLEKLGGIGVCDAEFRFAIGQ